MTRLLLMSYRLQLYLLVFCLLLQFSSWHIDTVNLGATNICSAYWHHASWCSPVSIQHDDPLPFWHNASWTCARHHVAPRRILPRFLVQDTKDSFWVIMHLGALQSPSWCCLCASSVTTRCICFLHFDTMHWGTWSSYDPFAPRRILPRFLVQDRDQRCISVLSSLHLGCGAHPASWWWWCASSVTTRPASTVCLPLFLLQLPPLGDLISLPAAQSTIGSALQISRAAQKFLWHVVSIEMGCAHSHIDEERQISGLNCGQGMIGVIGH